MSDKEWNYFTSDEPSKTCTACNGAGEKTPMMSDHPRKWERDNTCGTCKGVGQVKK